MEMFCAKQHESTNKNNGNTLRKNAQNWDRF